METARIGYECDFGGTIWTDITADVLQDPAPHFEYGIQGVGPEDIVADVGVGHFALRNSSLSSGGEGYYTPGHENCRAGWDDGAGVRLKIARGPLYGTVQYGESLYGETYYKWRGKVSAIRPSMGRYRERTVDVGCVDWMDQALAQNIAQIAIQTSKRVDQLLPFVLAGMTVQPRATSFAEGTVTFARFFDTDNDQKMSVISLLQKLAQNEPGYIYPKGDTAGGETLCFDARDTRLLNTTLGFILDNRMQDLEVEYARSNVKNLVRVKLYPKKIDAAATTVLYTGQVKFSIPAGQSMTVVCPFRDPTAGTPISAVDVVDPLEADTDFKFGSTEGSANNLNGNLTIVTTIGGNSAKLALTNNAGVTGWVNLLQLRGKGIYTYDPQIVEASDSASILARGELLLTWDLTQYDNPTAAETVANYLKTLWANPRMLPKRIPVIGNIDLDLLVGLLAAEPSTRFAMMEDMTGIHTDYHINGIALDIEPDGILRFELACVPADMTNYFIYDTSLWDVNTYWAP